MNGRYFSEEKHTEIMYTVFLSELMLTKEDLRTVFDNQTIITPNDINTQRIYFQ